jgi:hypothetical protein
MKRKGLIGTVGAMAVLLFAAGQANAALVLSQSSTPTVLPTGSTSLFNAIGTFQFSNFKSYLNASGFSTLQGGNPGNGWWGDNLGNPRPVRSWEVIWNNTTGQVTFNVYASNDWTGTAAMTMSRIPVFAAGNTLLGLDIGARLPNDTSSVTLGNVQFNGGSGWADVNTAEATYSGNANFNNYHELTGPLGNFTLRGTAIFPTGYSASSDNMRFFINARQGAAPPPVPLPAAAWLLGSGLVGLVALGRRRRK